MFVKVFDQILDSSIAENYELRHFFEDMLKLADSSGVVDMTPEAIARRINLPLAKVRPFLVELGQPDPKSRSPQHEGRRLVPVDSHRDWGWLIVNYEHYRSIRNEEARRAYNRDAKRQSRERQKLRAGQTLRQRVRLDVAADPVTRADNKQLRRLNGQTKAGREYDQDAGNPAPAGQPAG